MSTREVEAVRRLERAGLADLIAKRQDVYAERKAVEATLAKLNSQIMKLLAKEDIHHYESPGVKVAFITDATYTVFDRQMFIRYLIEHKVPPKVVKAAEDKATETKTKAPHIKVTMGETESE